MRINSYKFGEIDINGKIYRNDILITGSTVHSWWRKQGHFLQPPDLEAIWEYSPELLIIGTGNSGVMEVSNEVKALCSQKGVRLKTVKTSEAVKEFNASSDKKNTACGLHLTC